jgi:hypothetical protein
MLESEPRRGRCDRCPISDFSCHSKEGDRHPDFVSWEIEFQKLIGIGISQGLDAIAFRLMSAIALLTTPLTSRLKPGTRKTFR